ncbi:uncharacterized protein MONBRDRAFT_22127 [Monosiga brevicollis MX1]|uniref:Uncharacterized protein n=1 Tax=Monosiga brevicollis TaxID=81824 RepID=A9UPM9_MONBE|nr:uncharacterized protein MONBRDRAFT_22127 [Monosiga brevicollis MX1]EDQ92899.1 predicted protein [Monosiga brevicollis MX1]|eukprot:XP_001742661.1 hypothetical protein [Monosiga brevicollis MX1]
MEATKLGFLWLVCVLFSLSVLSLSLSLSLFSLLSSLFSLSSLSSLFSLLSLSLSLSLSSTCGQGSASECPVSSDRLPADQLVLGLVPHNGTSTTFAEHCLVPEWRASANHHLVCQYATRLGGHVTATARTSKDKLYLSSQKQLVAVAEHSGSLADRSQELTGGLGYNVIFAEQWRRESDVTRRAPGAMDRSDSATTLESEEDGPEDGAGGASLPLLTDLLACLAVGGVLVVEERLRLTEAEEELLVDAGATVQYYSPFLWTQGTAFQGHLLHMLQDIVRLVAQDLVQPHLERTVSLAELAAQWSDLTHAHRGPGSLVSAAPKMNRAAQLGNPILPLVPTAAPSAHGTCTRTYPYMYIQPAEQNTSTATSKTTLPWLDVCAALPFLTIPCRLLKVTADHCHIGALPAPTPYHQAAAAVLFSLVTLQWLLFLSLSLFLSFSLFLSRSFSPVSLMVV